MHFMKSLVWLLLLAAPEMVCAEELNQANTAWILTSTALVLFMTLKPLLGASSVVLRIVVFSSETS